MKAINQLTIVCALVFFAVACARPMPVHATYVPLYSDCDAPQELDVELVAHDPFYGDSDEVLWNLATADESEALFADYFVDRPEAYPFQGALSYTAHTSNQQSGLYFGESGDGVTQVNFEEEAPAKKKAPRRARQAKGEVKGVININTADAKQLTLLPGIGPSLAKRIVEYRGQRSFGQPQHLRRVKGIGKAKYEGIQKHVVTEGETTLTR